MLGGWIGLSIGAFRIPWETGQGRGSLKKYFQEYDISYLKTKTNLCLFLNAKLWKMKSNMLSIAGERHVPAVLCCGMGGRAPRGSREGSSGKEQDFHAHPIETQVFRTWVVTQGWSYPPGSCGHSPSFPITG